MYLGAACVVPSAVKTPKIWAGPDQLLGIGGVLGRDVTEEEVRTVIVTAARLAVKWLLKAAGALKRPRPATLAGEPMRLRFREAFGTAPEFVPTWRPGGQKWDRGDVVRARLLCAARILSNGSIEYFAFGPRMCPFVFDWRPTTWALIQHNVYVMCLGERFWQAFRDGDSNSLAATLLHESLHIYFDTVRDTRDRGAYGVAACYERFVLPTNDIPLPDYVKRNCESGVPAGDFPILPRSRAYA
jgi:hypothetical protein